MQIHTRRAKGTAVAVGLGAVLAAASLAPVNAASHREAPLTSQDPVADNTDTYAFISPNDDNSVTLIANYVPLQDPYGGPNYFAFGDDVRYDINVDNTGDAVADITFEFRFNTVNEAPGVPFYAAAPVTVGADGRYSAFNRKQTYSLTRVSKGVRTVLGSNLPVPPDNVGPRTTPNYTALANAAVRKIGNVSTFAGQRDEHFPVDLGSIFDLGGLRPFNSANKIVPLPDQTEGVNSTLGKNVHSIAVEVPIAELTTGGAGADPVIGVWATANRKKFRAFKGNSGAAPIHRGRWVQVSRLGAPLVNEAVIPISLKDTFNALRPDQDAAVLSGLKVPPFATEGAIPLVTDPIFADLIEVVYGLKTPADGSRSDLVAIYLTGIDAATAQKFGVPTTAQRNGKPAEMLRLNTSVKPDDSTPDSPLGFLGGDGQGFPNGRRLADDVIDITLRAVAGGTPFSPDQSTNVAPNNLLSDGVVGNDQPVNNSFPYNSLPHSGYDTGPNNGNLTGNGVDDNGANPNG